MNCLQKSGFALLLTGVSASAALGEMVSDLGAVPAMLKTREAKAVFLDQMNGDTPAEALRSAVPPGVAPASLAALLQPAGDTAPLGTVAAKPWSGAPGRMIALVCTGGYNGSPNMAPGCERGNDSPLLHVYLGVLAPGADGKPKLVAGPVAVDPRMSWQRSLLPNSPEAVEQPDASDPNALAPTSYDRLDVAPYRIAPDQPAFGIRASWNDGYAGGFGWHSALFLYAVIGGKLRQVLAVPILALTMFAGDWNKDGSRQHEIHEGANVVVVTDHLTAGHFDLIFRSKVTGGERRYTWRPELGTYR